MEVKEISLVIVGAVGTNLGTITGIVKNVWKKVCKIAAVALSSSLTYLRAQDMRKLPFSMG